MVVRYYGFTLYVWVSVRPSVSQSYIHLSVLLSFPVDNSQFSFPDDNLSKLKWIFTKLGICIDIVEIWFGIANGKFCQILTKLSA